MPDLGAVRQRLRSRKVLALLGAVVVALAAVTVVSVATSDPDVRKISQTQVGVPEPDGQGVRLEAYLYLPEQRPAPAVLLTPGFGGTADGLDGTARQYAEAGYVVLTYTPRGFGRSGGKIHFASPKYEVADMRRMVSYLATLPEVRKKGNDPEVAAAGSSYGGGLSLLLAGYDRRVDAVAADITWNNLENAFFPNFAGSAAGPFKKLWVGQLFGNGFGSQRQGGLAALGSSGRTRSAAPAGTSSCGRFAADVCQAYQQSAAAGAPTSALRRLVEDASPSSVISRIRVPTQLTQGVQDSLFPLSEADANARGIAANGAPVSVDWRAGGHDNAAAGGGVATANAISWFDKVFAGDNLKGAQPFDYNDENGSVNAEDDESVPATLQTSGYPGIEGTKVDRRSVSIAGAPQQITSPAGGVPAVITSIPGLGGISSRFDQALALLPSAPGQTAVFTSDELSDAVPIVGQSTVPITVTSQTATDAVLFVGLRDVDGSSATLPSQLVSPIKVTGLQPGTPRTVTVRLPTVVQKVLRGHRIALTVSASDFAYAGPSNARTYTIALPQNRTTVSVPTAEGREVGGGYPLGWLWFGLGACALVAALVGLIFRRRRQVLKPDPSLFDTPVVVRGLVKEYAGGYRAVDGISFTVEKGQVVGLLGPNGAGKTTALRVLVGLITATEGELYVFGQRIAPGAPVLSRLGSFIEGPGFLPHLTGRENLRLYWAATGRPEHEAEFSVALDIAGLGGSVDRRVGTYSQGMRQRLGIAQAMLGLPELLVLDEPTNGLDPPQIAEMREVMKQYAETGRTVVVSSHLLSEVEQTCTHVVVMHKGRVVSAGSVDEISGTDGAQLSVADPARAAEILARNGVDAQLVPARRSLEDVFLELIGEEVNVDG